MDKQAFFNELDARIAKYDLLCHPFYKAWAAGELSREDLREYACAYYHHVEAFPTYLAELAMRLEEGHLRDAVLANMCDEKGLDDHSGAEFRSHAELWLDFAEGMGAHRGLGQKPPLREVRDLISWFHQIASEATAEEALAAFYAYESQVPRVAQEKARGLREMYGADTKTTAYFTLHATADIFHSQVWHQQLAQRLASNPAAGGRALAAGEAAAKALWKALDGIDSRRLAATAA